LSEEQWFDQQGIAILDKYDCINYGGMWMYDDDNFDNVPSAMLTLFRMSLEAWTDEMYNAQQI
jgi:hypothetical protein